ncbi:hypothetical protein Trydic_g4615 [Trypoxylus dichotomus]
MSVTLYHFPKSAPSRTALLVARALGLDVDVQIVDLATKEQLKPDFVKINPQHTVPTLVDGDFILWESKAIAAYLVRTYAKDDTLYPKDPLKKALIDQRLHFDIGTLYPRIRAICFPVLYLGEIEIPDELRAPLDEALGFLDVFLEGNNFVTGNTVTIADYALAASVSSIVAVGWDVSPYANVSSWLTKCALDIPNYAEINQKGADEFGKAVRSNITVLFNQQIFMQTKHVYVLCWVLSAMLVCFVIDIDMESEYSDDDYVLNDNESVDIEDSGSDSSVISDL